MAETHGDGRRVVITGVGLVSPLGVDIDSVWEGLLAGRSGVGPITWFDASQYCTRFAACVKGLNPADFMDLHDAKRMDRFAQFSVIASRRAIEAAGLDLSKEDPTRIGVEIGSAIGGMGIIEEQSQVLRERGPRRVSPTCIPMVIVNMAACQVGIHFGLKGPTASPVAACATGIVAVGEAMWRLKLGYADVVLAGGTESADTPLGVAAFARLGALSTRNDAPEQACRPFDLDRDGTVLGEGAVVFVLETLEHAQARRANILAEVMGYGFSGDGYHVAAPDPSGDGAARAISGALSSARLSPADVQYIAAHGTGTPLNDVSETLAIKKALGQVAYKVPISSNKPLVGHMLGAAGAFSIFVLVQTIQHNLIHPTINLEKPDPDCDLDYVPGCPREARVDVGMANAFGFGGQNASLIVRRFNG